MDATPVDLDRLFDRFYPSLHRYCHRLTGDADLADDVAQEAFVRLVRRDVDGEPERLRGWLFRTALNLIRDRARVRSNRERLLEENPVVPDGPDPPDRRTERSEAIREVRRALEKLDARDRELLLMREEGFRYREIADAVGVATSSVGTLLARAQRKFANAYRETRDPHHASDGR